MLIILETHLFWIEIMFHLTGLIHPVDPFIDRIPTDKKERYLNDVAHQLMGKCISTPEFQIDDETRPLFMPYKRFVVYAKK